MEDPYNQLEEILIQKQIPYKREGNEFIVHEIFHPDLLKYAENVGLHICYHPTKK